jgi:hypothetical protein
LVDNSVIAENGVSEIGTNCIQAAIGTEITGDWIEIAGK